MNSESIQALSHWLSAAFPPEWVRAALVLAFISTLVVVGLFTYLNRYSRKGYFGRWTSAWLFYAVFLMAAIGLQETPEMTTLVVARRACIGISALYLFFGSLEFAHRPRPRREVLLGVLMMVAWSGVAAYLVKDILWITIPVFALLAAASVYTGALYLRYRLRYRGAPILAAGFFGWAAHLAGFPFIGYYPGLDAFLYVASAALALLIAMAMMVQMLEEAREQNESIVNQFQKGLAQCRALEQEVNLSEQRYRALFEASTDANFLVDLETHAVSDVNQAAYRMFSRGGGGLVGVVFTDICPSLQPLGKTMVDDRKRYDDFFKPQHEFTAFRTDGTTFIAKGEAKLVQTNKRPMMQVTIHEISERKKIEKQLRKAEKLSALGTLIAGVAHELNNPLAVIMGYSQLLAQRGEVSPKAKTELKKIVHESERAAKIVRNLLTFARPRDPEMTVIEINHLVTSVVESYERHAKANDVQFEKRLAAKLSRTKADTNQIEQVLTNLVANGIQAMAKHPAELRLLRVTTAEHGAYLRVTVEDTGPGIPAEILNKIFEPFFTTKPPGQGTGLGLAICQTIIEEHHGKIWVQNEPGSGAKFFIELPIIACDGETDAAGGGNGARDHTAPRALVPLRGRLHHRLLVVDDEPGIVEVLKEALSYQGYVIDTAENGAAALQLVARERYDLIISDLRMPDIDGEKMYHALRKLNPELAGRIIFLTGDTVSHKARTFLEWTGNHWFSKPFNIADLEQTIENFLGPTEPAPAEEPLLASARR